MKVWIFLFVVLFIIATIAWMWKQGFLAVLLYYAESGSDLPDKEAMEKYRMKVIRKSLHIRED